MKRSMKIILPVSILLAGFLAMLGLLNLQSEPAKRSTAPPVKSVQTHVVRLTDVPTEIIAYGRVASAQPVELFSEVAGTLFDGDLPFQPAQSFKKGNLLLRIDDRQARLELNSRKSELLTALAALLPEIKIDFPEEYRVWQNYFDACDFDRQLPTLPEAANEKIKLFLARFNVYRLYFAVRDLEIKLEKHRIYAPFAGSIISANLRSGSTARNGTLLGKIINLEQLEVEVPLPASDIRWIDYDQPVTFSSSETPGTWSGKINRVGSTIDTRTQTVQVFISIADGDRTSHLNGAFLKVEIPGLCIADAVSIPHRALYEQSYVYLITDGKLAYREVTVARRETNTVIVNGGLAGGDTLVVEALQGVAPGMPARSRPPKPPRRSS